MSRKRAEPVGEFVRGLRSETMGCPLAGDPIPPILRPVYHRREFANRIRTYQPSRPNYSTRCCRAGRSRGRGDPPEATAAGRLNRDAVKKHTRASRRGREGGKRASKARRITSQVFRGTTGKVSVELKPRHPDRLARKATRVIVSRVPGPERSHGSSVWRIGGGRLRPQRAVVVARRSPGPSAQRYRPSPRTRVPGRTALRGRKPPWSTPCSHHK